MMAFRVIDLDQAGLSTRDVGKKKKKELPALMPAAHHGPAKASLRRDRRSSFPRGEIEPAELPERLDESGSGGPGGS